MPNLPLQQELDDLAPVVAAWGRREVALAAVLRARDHQIEIALIEWVLASHELVEATRAAIESGDFRHQLETLESEGAFA